MSAPPVPGDRRPAYFDTAAVGLASWRLAGAHHAFVEEWADTGLDYRRGEQATPTGSEPISVPIWAASRADRKAPSRCSVALPARV